MDEDVTYTALNLDRDVVNPSQIRTVIKTFKENLFTQLFPYRKEVPKTLIFAKTDSHADDIIQIVREEFGEGNNFCQKITYQVEKPESVLSSFRNDYNPRIAVTVDILTPEQEQLFLDYIKNSAYYSQYYDAIYILLHTGLRISEFCGLTLKDIDLSSRTISINHQLLKRRDGSYYIEAVKTASGERILPMTDSVYCCIQRLIETRKRVKKEPVIDGYRDFIVLTKNNMPIVADHWNIRFRNILNSYNKTQDEPLPSITPHVCRHTYCTKMVQSGMNLKNLQYLMGHSDIKITLGTYTHTSIAIVQAEVEELERKGLIR